MKKQAASIAILLLCLAVYAQDVYGLGVSAPYLENNVLPIYKGGSALFQITLQNVDKSDVVVHVAYNSGMGTADALGYQELYNLPAGSVDTIIVFNITPPFTAKVGDTYDFRYSVAPVTMSEGGTIAFLPGISRAIKIQVIAPPKKSILDSILQNRLLGWVLIIAAAIYFGGMLFLKKFRKKRKRKK
jgi:hypothetical protein